MKREIHIFIFSVLFVAGQVLGIRSDACGQQVVFSAEDVELVASDTVQTHTFGIVSVSYTHLTLPTILLV